MLECQFVGDLEHFFIAVSHDYFTEAVPGFTRNIGGREDLKQALDLRHGIPG
ncbi:hypothetical protein D3C80_2137560 [compost metagenome]